MKRVLPFIFIIFMGFFFFDKDKLLDKLSVIPFIKSMSLTHFDSDNGYFSAIFKKGSNEISLNGKLSPLNATYEANFNNLHEMFKFLYGRVIAGGNVREGNGLLVSGKAAFAKGFGNFDFLCTKSNCSGNFKGNYFDFASLLKMVGINLGFINGSLNLSFSKQKFIMLNYDFNGSTTLPVVSKLKFKGNGNIFSPNKYEFRLDYISNFAKGNLNLNKDGGFIFVNSKAFVYLNRLRRYTLYPLKIGEYFDFSYSTKDNILNFKNKDLIGYYNNGINIQLNTSAGKFFRYVGIKPFIKGNVTGTISVKNKGSFDLIFSNAVFLRNSVIDYIRYKSHINLKNKDTLFLRGTFDRQKVVFNFITKNRDYSISVENGVMYYNGRSYFKVNVFKGDNKYVFEVKNGRVYLIFKRVKKKSLSNEVIVY